MIDWLLPGLLEASVSVGIITVFLWAVSPRLWRHCASRQRRLIWMLLALRLLLPVGITLPFPVLAFDLTELTVLPASAETVPEVETSEIAYETSKDAGITEKAEDQEPSGEISATPSGEMAAGSAEVPEDAGRLDAQEDAIRSEEKTMWADGMPILPFLTALWLAGAAGMGIYQVAGYVRTRRRLLRWSLASTDRQTKQIYQEILAARKIRRIPALRISSLTPTPLIIGYWKPVLLLPNEHYDPETLTWVLRHELTHLRQGDLWYKLLLCAAVCVHWYNPAVYLLRREANHDLEMACDDRVLADAGPAARRLYGRIVLSAADKTRLSTPLTTHFAGGVAEMKRRVKNIVTPPRRRGMWIVAAVLLAALLAGGLIACSGKPLEKDPVMMQPYGMELGRPYTEVAREEEGYTVRKTSEAITVERMEPIRISEVAYRETLRFASDAEGGIDAAPLCEVTYAAGFADDEAAREEVARAYQALCEAYGEPASADSVLAYLEDPVVKDPDVHQIAYFTKWLVDPEPEFPEGSIRVVEGDRFNYPISYAQLTVMFQSETDVEVTLSYRLDSLTDSGLNMAEFAREQEETPVTEGTILEIPDPPESYDERTMAWPYMELMGKTSRDVNATLRLTDRYTIRDAGGRAYISVYPETAGDLSFDATLYFGGEGIETPEDMLLSSAEFTRRLSTSEEVRACAEELYDAACATFGVPSAQYENGAYLEKSTLEQFIQDGTLPASSYIASCTWLLDTQVDYPEDCVRYQNQNSNFNYPVLYYKIMANVQPEIDVIYVRVTVGVSEPFWLPFDVRTDERFQPSYLRDLPEPPDTALLPSEITAPEDYEADTFSWPFAELIGMPLAEFYETYALEKDGYTIERSRLDPAFQKASAVILDGIPFDVEVFFQKEYEEIPLAGVEYENQAGSRPQRETILAIYHALCEAYGEPVAAAAADDVPLSLYETEGADGVYVSRWIVDSEPDFPPLSEIAVQPNPDYPYWYNVKYAALYLTVTEEETILRLRYAVENLNASGIAVTEFEKRPMS